MKDEQILAIIAAIIHQAKVRTAEMGKESETIPQSVRTAQAILDESLNYPT